MNNKILALLVTFVALPITGCVGMFPQPYAQPYGQPSPTQFNRDISSPTTMPKYQNMGRNNGVQVSPPPAQQNFAPQNSAMQMMHSQTMSEMAGLKERVRRVERAMIRLDRRMQLIERNALTRFLPDETMGEQGEMLNQQQPMQHDMKNMKNMQKMQPMSSIGGQNSFYNSGYQQTSGAGFQPVAYNPSNNKYVTSSLQAAPRNVNRTIARSPVFPSLADKKVKDEPASSVSIWTINYEERKIWPSREQLPGSRDVVEALRNGDKVTVFARGVHAASKEFRDRVRAISRYLGRVSGQKSVSIAAMPDDKMSSNTIEIIATK